MYATIFTVKKGLYCQYCLLFNEQNQGDLQRNVELIKILETILCDSELTLLFLVSRIYSVKISM